MGHARRWPGSRPLRAGRGLWRPARSRGRSGEAIRELGHEAVVERVRQDHDLVEDVVERLDRAVPVLVEEGGHLTLGELQMEREEIHDVLLWPIRVGRGEEAGD